jgi:transcriptional regulator with XRE-family HTH domain
MNKYSDYKLPSDILKELAERHREIRKRSKMSQAALAERSGVSLGSVKRFESTGQISLESLLKLASALNRLSDFDQLLQPGEDLGRIERLFNTKRK